MHAAAVGLQGEMFWRNEVRFGVKVSNMGKTAGNATLVAWLTVSKGGESGRKWVKCGWAGDVVHASCQEWDLSNAPVTNYIHVRLIR